MEINQVYPTPKRISRFVKLLWKVLKALFLFSGAVTVIVNLCVGGVPWCIVTCWSLYIAATLIDPPLINYDIISEGVLLTEQLVILLLIIELTLAGGWAHIVIPIVVSSALAALSAVFLSSVNKRRPNIMPLILLLTVALIFSAGTLFFNYGCLPANIVLCSISAALLTASVIVCGRSFKVEIKKYFHTR